LGQNCTVLGAAPTKAATGLRAAPRSIAPGRTWPGPAVHHDAAGRRDARCRQPGQPGWVRRTCGAGRGNAAAEGGGRGPLVDSSHVRSVRAPVPAGSSGTRRRARGDLPECSPGRRGRRAAATPLAPRLSTRGRLESLNRAFSGDCNYPVEEPLPMRALEEGGGGRPGQGSPAFLASAPNSE
jgi:hypothetical protein